MALTALLVTALQTLYCWRAIATGNPLFSAAMDYNISVSAPVHGLLAGLNPYDPSSVEYANQFGTVAAALHSPLVLLASAPAAVFALHPGYLIFTAVSCLMMWVAAWILITPASRGGVVAVIAVGALLSVAGPAMQVQLLGQLTAFVVLGVALALRYPNSWAGAAGVALTLICPQFGIGFAMLFVALRFGRTVWRAALITVAASLPIVVPAVVFGGGPAEFVRAIRENLAYAGGSENAFNRMDIPGLVGGGSLTWMAGGLILLLAAAVCIRMAHLQLTPALGLGAVALCLISSFSMTYYLPIMLAAAAWYLWQVRTGQPGNSDAVLAALSWAMIAACLSASLWITIPLSQVTPLAPIDFFGVLRLVAPLLMILMVLRSAILAARIAEEAGAESQNESDSEPCLVQDARQPVGTT